jgi:translation elongation factor EF-Tu-like GTPase
MSRVAWLVLYLIVLCIVFVFCLSSLAEFPEFKRHYIAFINVPGKENLVKNRICGAVQADHFLYVIDAVNWEERQMLEYEWLE